ncbi:MAG TPA: hypothetical protein VGD67_25880 [Pseudonocardiaceae bacterium]
MTASEDAGRKPRRSAEPDGMTDEEAADFYYAHRGDPEQEGDDIVIRTPAKRLSRVISVRFDPDEAAVIDDSPALPA